MAKKLTAVESKWSHAVLHDIFEAGGLIKKPVRTTDTNCIDWAGCNEEAKVISNEIKFRAFDFHKLDSAIKKIANYTTFVQLHEYVSKRLTENQIANIIAAFCKEQEIFWDDVNTLRTSVEMDTYRMSILGNACWNFECFLSQQKDKSATKTRAAAATRTVDPTTGKAVPKSGYKSSGPKSGLVKGLVGEPGEKTFLHDDYTLVFVIQCNSTKTKKQYAYVSPLVSSNVKLGDPSGYSDCKLFFKSAYAAEDFISKIESGKSYPSHISGFSLAKQKVDPNGYFLIETDLGPAYIKASKLNEELEEDTLIEEPKKRKSRFPEINDIDLYTEALFERE
jgi:hypothetical protein